LYYLEMKNLLLLKSQSSNNSKYQAVTRLLHLFYLNRRSPLLYFPAHAGFHVAKLAPHILIGPCHHKLSIIVEIRRYPTRNSCLIVWPCRILNSSCAPHILIVFDLFIFCTKLIKLMGFLLTGEARVTKGLLTFFMQWSCSTFIVSAR
jgi:hypothetical protein